MLGTSAGRTPRRVADGQPTGPTGALGHLRRSFFSAGVTPEPDPQQTLVMMEAPDRAAEVRVALRWLKAELLRAPDRPEEPACWRVTWTPIALRSSRSPKSTAFPSA